MDIVRNKRDGGADKNLNHGGFEKKSRKYVPFITYLLLFQIPFEQILYCQGHLGELHREKAVYDRI